MNSRLAFAAAKTLWRKPQLCNHHRGTPLTTSLRPFSTIDGIGRGTDLLADSLAFSDRPKIVFDGYSEETGFDVMGMCDTAIDTAIHMNGSVLAFPHACYMWKPRNLKEVTVESLAAVTVHDPPVELFFLGCAGVIPPRALNKIKKDFKKRGIIVEKTDLTNAMATFNILNGEDRRVAVALLLEDAAS
mmetsp:Transcript_38322/g.46809  ORF Transcript_38322/g.46809 Transcript_38322/m.46809 type:complete len:188 (-) Transcript_38322:207-770(-)